MKESRHVVLGIEREDSGTFEHAFSFAREMAKTGHSVEYYAHWFGGSIKRLDLGTEEPVAVSKDVIGTEGTYYLQSHTWEHDGLLTKISANPKSRIVMNLHAVIPYFYLPDSFKTSFLDGTLPEREINHIIGSVMSERERSQLNAIGRSDALLTISESHKLALERLGFNKRTGVFENVSDVAELDVNTLDVAKLEGIKYRREINAENVLLYCGRLGLGKRVRGLFDAFGEIVDFYPSTRLILLGSGEKGIEAAVKAGLNPRLLEKIVSVPWVDKNTDGGNMDILKYYFASDVLIQPVFTDGLFAKTVIDAMYVGLPSITCKSEYTLGSSETSRAIVDSFNLFKSNPDFVYAIVERAMRKVKRENTWGNYISRLEDFLSQNG